MEPSKTEPTETEEMVQHLDIRSEVRMDMDTTMAAGQQQPFDSSSSYEDSNTQEDDTGKSKKSLECKKYEMERKAYQLRQLRKFLAPKDAVTALHELQSSGEAKFTVNANGRETKAELLVNNAKYEAIAPNEILAKEKASEMALRDLALAQMARQQRTAQQLATGSNVVHSDKVEAMECIGTDNILMTHLASYALHKLFTEWKAEGFKMPIIRTSGANMVSQLPAPAENGADTLDGMPTVTNIVKELPPNATMLHPTVLFTNMRPQTVFEDLGIYYDQQNPVYVAGIRCDGHHFIGKGRSKRQARKAAAIDACKQLLGVVFDESVRVTWP